MKLSTRLVLLSMVMSALLIAVGLVGLQGMGSSNRSLKTVYEDRTVCLGQLADIQYRMVANAYLLGQVSDLSTPEELKRVGDQLDDNMATINKVWSEYMSTYLTPEEAGLAGAFAKLHGEYVNSAVKPGLAAVRAANITEVQHINDTVVSGALKPAKEQIAKLIQLQLEVASAEYERSVGNYGVVRNVAVASIVGGVLFSVSISYFLISGLRRTLAKAVHVSRTVANGDLSAVVDTRGKDELSTLMTALSDMQANLIKVVSQVRKGSETVANAAREIAQGNHDLSERTETQASSVEETATAMQQLGAQVRQNAENARLANGLAQSAVKVANEGGDVVGRVVETMRGINDSSRKIADIIGVIDGIAFQTNILALNAAVEAARAGEQGRGFAVVASEVRALAGRSATAAKEIKTLINASVERVEIGTTLVDRAGATMKDVVASIEQVTTIVEEISIASSQQDSGVAQIGAAVMSLDQVTQQNAALVEEMSAAAGGMKSQAQELVETCAVFTLESSDTVRSLKAPTQPAKARTTSPFRLPVFKPPLPRLASAGGPEGGWESF